MAATAFDKTNELFFETAKEVARFSPYTNNGGTALGVAGSNFVIMAADTRISEGYSIYSRNQTKVVKLTDKTVLATSGMLADAKMLHKVLQNKLEWYKHQNGKYPSTTAIAQLLSNTLYYKRFFPYYTFNVLGGIDDNGEGVCFSYDAVGSFEKVKYSSSGTGHELVQSIIDSQLGWKEQRKPGLMGANITLDDALGLVKDAFTSAGERDIYTGDGVDIFTITADSPATHTYFPLKKD